MPASNCIIYWLASFHFFVVLTEHLSGYSPFICLTPLTFLYHVPRGRGLLPIMACSEVPRDGGTPRAWKSLISVCKNTQKSQVLSRMVHKRVKGWTWGGPYSYKTSFSTPESCCRAHHFSCMCTVWKVDQFRYSFIRYTLGSISVFQGMHY